MRRMRTTRSETLIETNYFLMTRPIGTYDCERDRRGGRLGPCMNVCAYV